MTKKKNADDAARIKAWSDAQTEIGRWLGNPQSKTSTAVTEVGIRPSGGHC
jgi:hypothetical protein